MKNSSIQNNFSPHHPLQIKRATIGVFIKHSAKIEQGYFSAILAGITEAAHNENINLLYFIGSSLSKSADPAFNKQRNILYEFATPNSVDGLLIVDTVGNVKSQEELINLHQRKKMLPTISVAATITGIPSVVVDNEPGLQDALIHLIETHNYRRIAFIAGPKGNTEAQQRLQIFKDVLTRHKIPIDPNLIIRGDYSLTSGADATHHLLDKQETNFEAIVATNDNMALGALDALKNRGFIVPYDVAVIGFDDIKQAETVIPALTTVHQPLFSLGKQALENLVKQISNEPVSEQTILPSKLIIRRSCGCIEQNIPQIVETSQLTGDETVAGLFTTQSDVILAALSHQFYAKNKHISSSLNSWVYQLFDTFLSDSKKETENQFLSTLDQLIRLMVNKGAEVATLQESISILHQYLRKSRQKDAQYFLADTLLHQARSFISQEALHVQKQRLLQVEQQNSLLHAITQSFSSTLDVAKIIDILANNLSQLDIPSCYLVLYEDPQPYSYPQAPPRWAHLHLAYDDENGRIQLPASGQQFPTENLLPENTLPTDRCYTMMIEALYFQTTPIGYIIFEHKKYKNDVYETLRGQISSALNGALLLQKNKEVEAELKQHHNHLDALVQKRTLELLAANEHLQQEIKERQQVEKQLQFQATLLKNVSDAIVSTDMAWNVTSWNREAERLYGFKANEVIGKPFGELVQPEYPTSSREDVINAFLNDGKWAGKVLHHHKDGSPIHIWGSVSIIKNAAGTPLGAVSVNRDITQQKQAEKTLRESEERFREVVEGTDNLIAQVNNQRQFIYINHASNKVFGIPPEECIGMISNTFIDPRDHERTEQWFADCIQKKIARATIENRQISKTGEVRYISWAVNFHYDELGEFDHVNVIGRDMTERKLAEAELQQSQRNLAYAQKIAKVAYYYWHIQTNEVIWSDEMYHIFGVDKTKYTPEADTFGQFLHPDDLHLLSEENFAKMMVGKTHHMEFRIFEQTTNALKHVYLWGETTFSEEGHPITIFGIIQDITERRIAEIKLEAYTAELERSNQDLQEFAYVASHDLQEPLRKIQTFGDRLQHKYHPVLDERGLNYVNRMQSAASRMQGLIIDLLAFSRVRTHVYPFKKINLNHVVQYVLQNLEISIEEKEAKIIVDELPAIDADVLQMGQLFQNLLSNALKFSHPDRPLKIQIQCNLEQSHCEILVIDNGIGFDEKYLDRIFTVFERLHNRDEYPGTGIGLAICRRIIERHQGSISAISKLGEGATFVVNLPRYQESD